MSQQDGSSEAERHLLGDASCRERYAPIGGPPRSESPDQALWPVLVGVGLFVTAVAMTIPSRPKLILDAIGDVSRASYFSGIVDALTASVEIVTNPVLGAVSDVTGRRPILILSQMGEFFALLIIARFHMYTQSYIVAYLLIGLTGVFFMTTSAVLGDLVTSAPLGSADSGAANYGALGATYGACFMVGPAIGGLLEANLYPTASFHFAAALVLVSVVWTYFFVPETRARDDDAPSVWEAARSAPLNPLPRIQEVFSSPVMRWLAAGIAVSSLAQGGLNSIFFLYLNTRLGWETKDTGYFLSAIGLSLLVVQGFLVKPAVGLLGEKKTIVVGYAFSVLHYMAYASVTSGYIAYMGLALGAVSLIAEPAMKGLLCRQVDPSRQGALQGALGSISTLLRPLAPLIATTIFGYGTSVGAPGLVFGAISALSAVSFTLVLNGMQKTGLK